jgi:hypothetical protein
VLAANPAMNRVSQLRHDRVGVIDFQSANNF